LIVFYEILDNFYTLMGGEFQGISTKWIGARLQGPGITLLNLHLQVGSADFNRAGDEKQVSGIQHQVSGGAVMSLVRCC